MIGYLIAIADGHKPDRNDGGADDITDQNERGEVRLVTMPGMEILTRQHDWAATALGACETWPQSLRTTVDTMLASGHAMCVMRGPERIFLYNDVYAPFLGNQHPAALGKPAEAVWPDVWDDIEPLIERTFAGETCAFHDEHLTMTRHGFEEETWWDFSYSPIRDESGGCCQSKCSGRNKGELLLR